MHAMYYTAYYVSVTTTGAIPTLVYKTQSIQVKEILVGTWN